MSLRIGPCACTGMAERELIKPVADAGRLCSRMKCIGANEMSQSNTLSFKLALKGNAPMSKLFSFALLVICFLLPSVPMAKAAVLVTNGSSWKYFIGTQEASTPANVWRQLGFADGAWQDGIAPIGYAVPP